MQLFHLHHSSIADKQHIDPLQTVPFTGQANLEPKQYNLKRSNHGF